VEEKSPPRLCVSAVMQIEVQKRLAPKNTKGPKYIFARELL
jgi:hypothetical protein